MTEVAISKHLTNLSDAKMNQNEKINHAESARGQQVKWLAIPRGRSE